MCYGNDIIGKLASAMSCYFGRNVQGAIRLMEGLEDEPEAWLYFSLFHARAGDLDKAEHFARRAMDAGNPDAAEHLHMIAWARRDEEGYRRYVDEWGPAGNE